MRIEPVVNNRKPIFVKQNGARIKYGERWMLQRLHIKGDKRYIFL